MSRETNLLHVMSDCQLVPFSSLCKKEKLIHGAVQPSYTCTFRWDTRRHDSLFGDDPVAK
jgi:hypothetical protein